MVDILRSNISSVFSNNPATMNAAGGYAVWSVPPSIARAFNPLTFRRDHFLHRIISTAEPSQTCKPNYALISGTSIIFDYNTASTLCIVVKGLVGGVSTTLTKWVSSGIKTFSLSNDFSSITSIESIGPSAIEQGNYYADASYIYVRAGYAYQDEDFICNASGSVLYRDWTLAEDVSVTFTGEGGKSFTLTASSYRGTAFFDASPVVRHWFASSPAVVGGKASPVPDRLLFVRYAAKCGYFSIGGNFLALNAVAQVGEGTDMSAYDGAVLTTLPTLKLYNGFPFDYSVLAGANDITLENGGTAPARSVVRVGFDEDSDYDVLQDDEGNNIVNEDGQLILLLPSFDIPVNVLCIPPKPFWVRWVNALGGIDYFMFAKHRTRKPQVKSSSIYRPYVGDNSAARTNRVPYGVSTEHELTCGAENLTRIEYASLGWLPFSPYIEYWDADAERWVRISTAKYSGSIDEWDERKPFEITFALPDINTQF